MQRHECSFGGFRLSPTPPTRLDDGLSRAKHVACGKRTKHRASKRLSTAIQQCSFTPPASRNSTKTTKSARLTIRRGSRTIQSKKSSVEKSRFQLTESDCIIIDLKRGPRRIQSKKLQSEKALFDWRIRLYKILVLGHFLHSRKRAFSTQLFSTEFSDWGIQSKKSTFSTGSASRKIQPKKFTSVFLTHCIAHPTTKHTPTRPHTQTRYHTVSYKALTLAWLSLLFLLAPSQRGAFLAPLAGTVYHTMAAARGIDPISRTTATSAVALAALG